MSSRARNKNPALFEGLADNLNLTAPLAELGVTDSAASDSSFDFLHVGPFATQSPGDVVDLPLWNDVTPAVQDSLRPDESAAFGPGPSSALTQVDVQSGGENATDSFTLSPVVATQTTFDSTTLLLCGCAACAAARGETSKLQAVAIDDQTHDAVIIPDSSAVGNGVFTAGVATAPSYATAALINEYGFRWGSAGTTVTVTYSFLTSVPGYYPGNADERTNFVPMSSAAKTAARDVFALYAEVANIKFVEVAAGSGSINLGSADLGNGIGGWAYYPYPGYTGSFDNSQYGDVWITNRYSGYDNPQKGSWQYNAYIHEIGHAIGMKHPGNYNAGGGGTGGPYLPAGEDNHQYTVMSYYSGPSYGSTEPITPQLYDVATIQQLYGINTSTRTGNDTYTFSTSLQIKTIWDGGGTDTFDASNQNGAVSIDLHAGSFSSIAGTNNVAIAYGAAIEIAIGSNYGDTLRANDAGDTLIGGAGNDTLAGGGGADRLIGGTGVDTIMTGPGADVIVFAAGDSSAVNHDMIADFTPGSDQLDLSGIDADISTPGLIDAFRFIGTLAFDGLATELNYFFDSLRGVTVVQGDTNGDRVADFAIDLSGNLTLTRSDFTAASLRPLAPLNLVGTAGADLLVGDILNDTLSGLGGSDTLRGNAGSDLLDGGTGADTLIGGSGDDTYVVDDAGDVVTEVYGASFTVPVGWSLKGTADFDHDGETDVLVTNGSANEIWLLQGGVVSSTLSMRFYGGNWPLLGFIDYDGDGYKDLLYQNTGSATQQVDFYVGTTTRVNTIAVTGRSADALLSLVGVNEGTDTVQSSISYVLASAVENLTLASGAGGIGGTGNTLANVILGNEGANVLSGKGGADTLTGNAGADTFAFADGETGAAVGSRDLITDFTVGTDKLDLSGFDANTTASGLNSFRFLGTSAFDGTAAALRYSYDSGRGVTVVEGDTNGDRVADFAIDLSGNKVLTSADFAAGSLLVPLNLTGTAGADTLMGGELSDTLSGLGGSDTLRGNAGSDLLDGGTGADTLIGGSGDDTYVVDDAGDVVTEVYGASFTVPVGWSLKGTADFDHDGETDVLVTNGSANEIWLLQGGVVSSTLSMRFYGGNWPLLGFIDYDGDGYKDLLYQNTGSATQQVDFYVGTTTRVNTIAVTGRSADALLSLVGMNEGTDTVQSSISYVLASAVENLTLASGAGGIGGTGNTLANVILGNEGANVLSGKGGADTLTGNAGADTFVYLSGETGAAVGSRDLITDFTVGTDKLDLSGFDANTAVAGLNSFRFLGTSAFDGTAAALRYSYDSGRGVTVVEGDTNGDRVADFAIDLSGNKVLTSADFAAGSLLVPLNLTGTAGADTLMGGELSDTLSGLGGSDTLRGNAGSDLLDGGTGADTLIGGSGDDTYVVDDAGDVVTEVAGEGTDTVQSSISYVLASAVENLTLASGAGGIGGTGNTLANVILGNEGANVLSGKGGADTLTGNAGADTFAFADGETGAAVGSRDLITDFTVGTDKLDLSGFDANTTASGLNSFRFLGTSAFDGTAAALRYSYDSGRGVTVVEGDTNGDRVADFAIDLSGNKVLTSADFAAGSLLVPLNLTGTAGADTLMGGELSDTLSGLGGSDTLRGNAGSDLLDGGTGADTLIGGSGDDTYVVDDAGDVVTEVYGASFTVPVGWSLKGTADFDHDGETDVLVTNGSANEIWLLQGGVVSSTLSMRFYGGNWPLLGFIDYDGDGYKDLLYQNTGSATQQVDFYVGTTTRVNTIAVTGRSADALLSLVGVNEGTDTVQSSISYVLASAVENLTLASGAGGIGGTGNTLANVILGNEGANVLSGKGGADTLTGNAGADTFVYLSGETGAAVGSRDLITDFTVGTDKLDLSGFDANTAVAGLNSFRFLGTSAFDGTAAALRYSYDSGRGVTVVEGDTNGDRVADFAIDLSGNKVLTSADFAAGSLLVPLNLTGTAGADTLMGGELSDTLSGLGGSDTLRGNAGSDLLDGGTGADTLIGGSGDDTYVVDDAGDVVTEVAGEGTDTVQSSIGYVLASAVENLTLASGAGGIGGTGNALANVILGNEGANMLSGKGGADTLTGNAGADTFAFADGETGAAVGSRDLITDFTVGTDKLDLSGFDANTTASGLNSFRFLGTSAFDGTAAALRYSYDSGRGVTVVEGDTNGDRVADFAIDLSGNKVLTSADFAAGSLLVPLNLTGTAGADTLMGGELSDTLSGLGGSDTLRGNAGSDLLDGGTGADTLIGGSGDDTYVVDDAGDVVTEVYGASFTVPVGWSLKGTADFDHDGETDVLVTNGSANEIWLLQGGVVSSTLSMRFYGGNWPLLGFIDYDGDGYKDLLYQNTGSATQQVDFYVGTTTRVNTIAVTGRSADALLSLVGVNEGTDTVQSSISYVLASAVENLTLASGAGGIGGTGNTLANVILGNEGANVLSGKGGADTLTGNAGADTFAFADGETGAAVGSRDLITDFTVGTDKLDLSGFDANTTASGLNSFRFLGTSAFDGTAAALRYSYDSGRGVTVVEGDTNGDRVADFAIDLSGNKVLTSADFAAGSLLVPLNLTGTAGADTLMGGELSDTLSGLGGSDTLRGNAGSDLLDGGTGADTLIGGSGDDTYVVDDAGDVVTEVYGASFTVPVGWSLKGTADFDHDGETDVLVTNGSANEIWLLQGGVVSSTLSMRFYGGNWPLLGFIDYDGDGYKDLLYQNTGSATQQVDFYVGTTTRVNTIAVTGRSADALLSLVGVNEGTDTVQSSISYVLASAVENLTLASGAGGIGGTGNTLANVILGNEGANVLSGKGGADTLTGNAGADTFVYQPNFGKDTITDFQTGQDVLEIDHTLFNTISDVLAHTVDDGLGNAIITAGPNDIITLDGVTKSALTLHSSDIHLI